MFLQLLKILINYLVILRILKKIDFFYREEHRFVLGLQNFWLDALTETVDYQCLILAIVGGAHENYGMSYVWIRLFLVLCLPVVICLFFYIFFHLRARSSAEHEVG